MQKCLLIFSGLPSVSSGGEPMLHPQFCDFLRKAKDYDFSVNILTNLTLLNDEIIAEMKNNRLSSVQVSLY
ncbi:radical SAM protein, partial [Treponema sp. R8-4-B8]